MIIDKSRDMDSYDFTNSLQLPVEDLAWDKLRLVPETVGWVDSDKVHERVRYSVSFEIDEIFVDAIQGALGRFGNRFGI